MGLGVCPSLQGWFKAPNLGLGLSIHRLRLTCLFLVAYQVERIERAVQADDA